jgi:hypothetical protein
MHLHDTGVLSARLFGSLLAVSVVASYVSKVFLVGMLGSPLLLKRVALATAILAAALAGSWSIFMIVSGKL